MFVFLVHLPMNTKIEHKVYYYFEFFNAEHIVLITNRWNLISNKIWLKKIGADRGSNSEPLAPEARIIPLDHRPIIFSRNLV
jgi:hypothetical protein